MTFHSSALWSIRRNVRKAQLVFAAEAGNNCSAQSPVIWSTRTTATYVTLSNPHPFPENFFGFLFPPAVVDPIKKSLTRVPENRRLAWKRIGVFRGRREFQACYLQPPDGLSFLGSPTGAKGLAPGFDGGPKCTYGE